MESKGWEQGPLLSALALHLYILLYLTILLANSEGPAQPVHLSDCADVQADLGRRCPHMPEDTILYCTAQ